VYVLRNTVGADAAAAAIDDFILRGRLVEQAVDDHDVRKHFASGRELIEDFAKKQRKLDASALPDLRVLPGQCAVRERCRLRKLLVQ
jgi:hypothetical protein